jgi:hypothetical protein
VARRRLFSRLCLWRELFLERRVARRHLFPLTKRFVLLISIVGISVTSCWILGSHGGCYEEHALLQHRIVLREPEVSEEYIASVFKV